MFSFADLITALSAMCNGEKLAGERVRREKIRAMKYGGDQRHAFLHELHKMLRDMIKIDKSRGGILFAILEK